MKTATLESKFPLLAVENGCIISKDADITVAYRVELPELFSLHEFSNLRCRVTWKQKRVSYQESPLPIEVKVVEDHKYQRWFVTFTVLMVLCFIGIITLFFSIPNLYKQDIHFLRNDTIHQEFSISNSRIDLKDVSLTNHGGKDTLVIKDKKIIIAK